MRGFRAAHREIENYGFVKSERKNAVVETAFFCARVFSAVSAAALYGKPVARAILLIEKGFEMIGLQNIVLVRVDDRGDKGIGFPDHIDGKLKKDVFDRDEMNVESEIKFGRGDDGNA